MQSGLYVALSAQIALQNRLETIAQNVANGTSAGYRGSEMKFDAVLSKMSDPLVSFVSSGSGVIKRSSGEHVKTGNPLDVAVRGDGWLSVATPSGQAYTRDGRMRMTSAGDLVSMTGARNPRCRRWTHPDRIQPRGVPRSPRTERSLRMEGGLPSWACSHSQATPSSRVSRGMLSHRMCREPQSWTPPRTASRKASWSNRT